MLVEGKTELLVLYNTITLHASYNQALDTGEKNNRLVKNERYYCRSGKDIIELDKKGKELSKLMGSKIDKIMKQIDDENLSFKNKEDLIKIVSYMNAAN